MADILKQLGIDTLPAVRTFCAEAAPSLACVPIEQRVREFLAQRYGAIWYGASVDSYASREMTIHAASLPSTMALAIEIVVEHDDGTFSCAAPLPPECEL